MGGNGSGDGDGQWPAADAENVCVAPLVFGSGAFC